MDAYESVLLVKPEVFVFNLPPRSSNRSYRAADWNLAEPAWTGRMRLVAKGNEVAIKLEDKSSGELYAKCPIESYPGVAVEAVSDSSRYFVLRIQDDNGRTAFIGLGFGDRSDSFDLNVALQDHFKWLKKEKQISEEPSGPALDLGFKEGETIKINMKIMKKDGSEVSKSRSRPGAGLGLLPPPPGGSSRLPAPPGSSPAGSPAHAAAKPDVGGESWGEFTSAQSSAAPAQQQASPSASNNWVQF
ncbi:PREDICTED: NECAP-like protein CG9132 [Nicrophorus vespilloides]|uniref:NECAP-like protein CG9132 n=1 Tax=Nicrophorus vespilloides TaxID=110193 RepID=A0ABM1MLS4_NICVS|nr:PREDICTED: NECAP-like protein CG9132 [Nicrophorus vespilloides]